MSEGLARLVLRSAFGSPNSGPCLLRQAGPSWPN